MQRCTACGAGLTTDELSHCAVCGSAELVAGDLPKSSAGFHISFTIFGCDNCGQIVGVAGLPSDRCTTCGSELQLVDRQAEVRAQHFGADLVRLQERLEYAQNMEFSDSGDRIPAGEFRQWLFTSIQTTADWADRLPEQMGDGDFDDPGDARTASAWSNLLGLTNEMLDLAIDLKSSPAPPTLLSAHRATTAGIVLFGAAAVGFFTTLTAPTAEVARERMDASQQMLDSACEVVLKAANLMTPLDLDTTTAASGSSLGSVFPELADIAKRDPVMLRPLIPLVTVARGMHDQQRRARRAAAVRAAFDAAAAAQTQWIGDFDFLLTTCSKAWRKLITQHQRLTQLVDADDRTRPGWIDDLLDIGAKLVEGPYRAYGNTILDARKVAHGDIDRLDSTTAGTASFGTVRANLATRCPELAENIYPIIRHASAHYDYQPEGQVVRIQHLPPRGNGTPLVETYTFDDLLAAVANLSEHTIAMANGVTGWVWSYSPVPDRERFRRDWLTA
ncbi:hypothetical protein [Nocardia spumae]|uniref:hypothetical protein n=1 Tax=Nocardia spumae TaxID=2887190 RepID=UPI001D15E3C2|nr:hypothetical protein [Nocardia spumae]